MFRPTGLFALAGAVVFGIILADALAHPAGVTAVGNSVVSAEKVSANALLGQTS